ncbi:rRNA maturation RNase YbeY [Poritiphilus flavus]|uniref:Endoribonuclease YbeY n=1 Tax=Poritiphilus flavus TaxID=2697053 RepID=A0A6L9E8H0_9FLAO|nr:rRNA maturation RNase YbeY [Poritiphilus flavus]NAS11000.1 rRNA maturation RNase YbeY [Poritiphilus flavus]
MIEFHYELDFALENDTYYADWIARVIKGEGKIPGKLNYIFCSDEYLWDLNKKYLDHDTLTDIITFEYSEHGQVSGDIFISVDRVRENADTLDVSLMEELRRVMVHGVLHLLGYGDKTETEKKVMRELEEEKMKLFHVEQ